MDTLKQRGKRLLRRIAPGGVYQRIAAASCLFTRNYWYQSNVVVETLSRWLKIILPVGVYEWLKRRVCALLGNFWHYEWTEREAFFRRAFKALSFNGIDGDYFEFGSHTCGTFRMAHRWSRRHGVKPRLFAFDSFEGLPDAEGAADDHPRWVRGDMSTGLSRFRALCRAAGITEQEYRAVPGFYEQSLRTPEAASLPNNLCMAYIDCDLYSSTREVLAFLEPRLKHGMILAFDDYFCYSKDEDSGERRACAEFFGASARWRLVPFQPFGWAGMSFIVQHAAPAAGAAEVKGAAGADAEGLVACVRGVPEGVGEQQAVGGVAEFSAGL